MTYNPWYTQSWALLVGINLYNHFSPLTYACNDVQSLKDLLISKLSFNDSHIVTLLDSDATKSRILSEFINFHTKAGNPDDRIIVFFAGHGHTQPGISGPIGYLVPVDGYPGNLSSLIRWDDLTRNADIISAKHILFIMDACYSGLAVHRATPPGTQRFVSDMLQRLSRQVITAGKADETVADGGGPSGNNSIFTGFLLGGDKWSSTK